MRPRLLASLTAIAALGLIAAPAARASFHLMSIREVYPGGADNASYVELQMYASGQQFVAGRHLVAYNANGTVNDDFSFPANLTNGANQATILLADTSYGTVFVGDPPPDASDANLNLSPAGGAVCWTEASPPDCVAWGNFTGPLPAHVPAFKVGNPVSPAGVSAGKALRRSIANGCPTYLDPPPTDDSDDSATDFSEVAPQPRNQLSPIQEVVCSGVPDTSIDERPPLYSNSTEAEFTYAATNATSFECKLDSQSFGVCAAAGKTYTALSNNSHTFEVRGVNASGRDPTPAAYTWTVDTVAPTATIATGPPTPSPGNSAAFTYSSNEAGSTFECSLEMTGDPATFSSCPLTGKTYPDASQGPLADGEWTFEVRAIDLAGNVQGAPTPYTWTVDNSVADTTPPQTTIVSKPPDPSTSAEAAFTYSSNEAGSSFECSLDAAPFAACSANGIGYTNLANGPHTFMVRAIDSSNNVDPTPAAYTFSVAAEPGPPGPPKVEPPPPPPGSLQTSITGKPGARTSDRTPTFKFRASIPGASFRCAVDRGRFKPCRSPFTTAPLKPGRHTFAVKAVAKDAADPTPARFSFKVVKKGR